jgi:hypothetical protein
MQYKKLASLLFVASASCASLQGTGYAELSSGNLVPNLPVTLGDKRKADDELLQPVDFNLVAQEKMDKFYQCSDALYNSRVKFRHWVQAIIAVTKNPYVSFGIIKEYKSNAVYYLRKIKNITSEMKALFSDGCVDIFYETPLRKASHAKRVRFAPEKSEIEGVLLLETKFDGMEVLATDEIFDKEDPNYRYNWEWDTFASKKIPENKELPIQKSAYETEVSQFMRYVQVMTALKPAPSRIFITTGVPSSNKGTPEELFETSWKSMCAYTHEEGMTSEDWKKAVEAIFSRTAYNRNLFGAELIKTVAELKDLYVKGQGRLESQYNESKRQKIGY